MKVSLCLGAMHPCQHSDSRDSQLFFFTFAVGVCVGTRESTPDAGLNVILHA